MVTQMGILNILNFIFTSSIIIEQKRQWRVKRNLADGKMEIANMEYGEDAPILFQQVNIIFKLKNNASDGKRSNPMWSKLMR